jgi:hypothetical protein
MGGIPEDIVRGNEWRTGADVTRSACILGAVIALAALLLIYHALV